MSKDNILDLSDLAPSRHMVKFREDGELTRMVTPVDLSIRERSHLWAVHEEIQNLGETPGARKGKRRLTETEREEFAAQVTRLYTEAATIILPDMSADEIRELADFHKEAVVLAFFASYGRAMEKIARKTGGRGLARVMTEAAISGN